MTKVFSLSQLPTGHKHQVKVGDYDVLLANVDGQVYAVENKCSHYGLPLDKGAICEHRIRCPFHHACFDLRTGEQIEAPGMDGLPSFDVRLEGDDIHVSEEPVRRNTPDPIDSDATPAGGGHYKYAIVGGGVAAAYAAESIRAEDPTGSLLMLSREMLPPYDRTKVSKAFMEKDMDKQGLPLRSATFYNDLNVDFRAVTQVQRVDLGKKKIQTKQGEEYTYERILLATGAKPNELKSEGSDLEGIHTVRKAKDAIAAREATSEGTRVVIIGGSFIAMESAMSLGKRGSQITVVTPEEILFEKVFGEKVGRYIQSLHEAEGVRFMLGRKSSAFEGDGRVSTVVLDNGEKLPADVVIVGIGVTPATDYVSGIAYQEDHSIAVDAHLMAHADGVYVAGDMATYPDREGLLRIEHWKVAAQQGRIAGRNMAGRSEPYSMLPYFWSNQQGTNLRYVGHGTDFDDIVFDGEPGDGPFMAFYVKDKHVQACLGVKRDGETAAVGELMSIGKMPAIDALVGADWHALCRQA